jgi:hypothetical protein
MSEREKPTAEYIAQATTTLDKSITDYYREVARLELLKQQILEEFKNGATTNEYVYVKERSQLDHKIAEMYIKTYQLDVPFLIQTKVDWKFEHQIRATLAENNLPVPDQIIHAYFKRRSEKDE